MSKTTHDTLTGAVTPDEEITDETSFGNAVAASTARTKEHASHLFAGAWGVVRNATRAPKRAFLFAKDHPSAVWNATRTTVIAGATIGFLFYFFSYMFMVNPFLGAGVIAMGLIILAITGQTAITQRQLMTVLGVAQ
jgi:hypothetical protein